MPLPHSLHGNEYYENLSSLRDEALMRSNAYGKRRCLGRIAWGYTHAQWNTDSGGMAYLEDEGVRIGGITLFNLHPTTMRIFNTPGSAGTEVVTFKMELDNIGDIEVFRNIITSASLAEIIRAKMSKHADRRHDMTIPTNEELALAYNEMERGASGIYAA